MFYPVIHALWMSGLLWLGLGQALANTAAPIAGDPDLAAADAILQADLESALAPLSPHGRQIMRQAQRAWLDYARTLCASTRLGEATLACWRRQYALRQAQLAQAVVRGGDFTLLRVDRYEIRPDRTAADGQPGIFDIHRAYPQIDRPRDAAQARWNVYIERQALAWRGPPGEPADVSVDYRVTLPGPRVISTTLDEFYYVHHAAHGLNSIRTHTWLLDENRPLEAQDLFVPSRDWQGRLQRLCQAELMRRNAQEQQVFTVRDATALEVADPMRWSFSPRGLGIQFEPYEVGPYVAGAPLVEISWRSLRGYLIAHPPITISRG